MHWIKEVEIAKPIDELMTSQSITGRTDFPDYDVLDAMIDCVCVQEASHQMCALPKKSECRRATCSKLRPILTRKADCLHHFRATRAHEAAQGLTDLLNLRLQNDDVQEFDVRWDQAP